MTRCPNCQSDIQQGVPSCPYCGAQLGQLQAGFGQPQAGFGQPQAGFGQPQAGFGQPQAGFGPPPVMGAMPYPGGALPSPVNITPAYIVAATWLLFFPILAIIFFVVASTAKSDAERGEVDKARGKLKIIYVTTGVIWGLVILAGLAVTAIRIVDML